MVLVIFCIFIWLRVLYLLPINRRFVVSHADRGAGGANLRCNANSRSSESSDRKSLAELNRSFLRPNSTNAEPAPNSKEGRILIA